LEESMMCLWWISTLSGHVKVLDKTYANCVNQTSARLLYAVALAENLLIFGADVSNAFAEAPPPKQGFYIHPDKAFVNWLGFWLGNLCQDSTIIYWCMYLPCRRCHSIQGQTLTHCRLSPYHPQKPSSWQHATLDVCVYSYAASYGT
jgi:hypothetical protein